MATTIFVGILFICLIVIIIALSLFSIYIYKKYKTLTKIIFDLKQVIKNYNTFLYKVLDSIMSEKDVSVIEKEISNLEK